MFRKMYANFELSEDKNFAYELQEKFNLDSWFYQSCKVEVKAKLDALEQIRKEKQRRITEIERELIKNDFTGRKGKRRKYKLCSTLNYLQKSICADITFGGKELLRKISFLSNDKEKNKAELEALKQQYNKKRLLPICSIGESPQASNRKFKFDFANKRVVFKPEKQTKIPIEFHCSKKQHAQLMKLQERIGSLAITVCLDTDYLYITYDEEKLAGYAFDKDAYMEELRTIPRSHTQKRKNCFIRWAEEQKKRQLLNKLEDRYISIDLNPEFIGIAVLQKIESSSFKILHKECISFANLNTKLRLSSKDEKQVKQNNKRIHELREVWKYIFKLATHYKCANFIMEELEFKQAGVNQDAKEANRKTRNLWYRDKTEKLIQKYCNTLGIQKITVNSAYSSFIGNIKYNYYDPLNAAIEIGRRGITKYLKGLFYPKIERSDFDSMSQFGLDVQNKTISSWVKAFKLFKTAGLKYRRELDKTNFVESNLQSHKSNTILYSFL